MSEPLVISREELADAAIDRALRERAAISQTKRHYETAQVTGRVAPKRRSPLQIAAVYLTLFGLCGGLIGWAGGQALYLRDDPRAEANQLLADRADVDRQVAGGTLTPAQAGPVYAELDRAGASNGFYRVETAVDLTADERAARFDALAGREDTKRTIADVLLFALAGACIAAALSAAEPAVGRNVNAALAHGAAGAALGLAGGLAAGLLAGPVRDALLGGEAVVAGDKAFLVTQAVLWGMLGLFLSAAPGLVMRSLRRTLVGVAGGALGGMLGGLLYGPVLEATGSEMLSRLMAIGSIGAAAGLATALVEDAVKDGWLRVAAGAIAGKQFVLYRDPTYIGSAPNSHIYLFNDRKVGRRHAAVHKTPGGFEIENLPLGGPTLVNGRAVSRARLLRGDTIEVGTTRFEFGEKPKAGEPRRAAATATAAA